MGKPGPQPRSITQLACGSVFAHFLTSFTPIAIARVLLLPRRARNSPETASYPLDRSIRWSIGPVPSGVVNWRRIAIALIVLGILSGMAFHEKAGRSQVDSF